jgi:hypothetical protein
MSGSFDPLDQGGETHTKYRFFPYVRRGYPPTKDFSRSVARNHNRVDATGSLTVTYDVVATDDGGSTSKDGSRSIDMYGPESIEGIDARQVVRMEPEPETTNVPPNYFPLVEFDDADLPWLFSPVGADSAGRAQPWLCLAAVERSDDVTLENDGSGPLPTIETPVAELPPVHQAWAWAHAQVVGSPVERADDSPNTVESFEREFGSASEITSSRLLCPRKLEPNTRYYAVVLPTFEAGVQAGLGREPPEMSGSMSFAWKPGSGKTVTLPVYHHWTFATGKKGDFEYLARQLEPRDLNDGSYDIGTRPVDVTDPGPPELARDSATTADLPGALQTVGSSLAPYDRSEALRKLLDAPERVTERTGRPVVGAPVYGQWHAQADGLDASHDADVQWLYDLNLQPGYRVAARLGGDVVRDNQEALMAEAWDQVGEIRAANRRMAAAQLSRAAMERDQARLKRADAWTQLQLTAPAHDRVLYDGTTVGSHLDAADFPRRVLSAPFRRLASAGGPLARRLEGGFDPADVAARLVADADAADSLSAPERGRPGARDFDRAAACRRAREMDDPGGDPGSEPPGEVREVRSALDDLAEGCDDLLDLLDRLLDLVVEGEISNALQLVDPVNQRWAALRDQVLAFEGPFDDLAALEAREDLPSVSDDLTPDTQDRLYGDLDDATDQETLLDAQRVEGEGRRAHVADARRTVLDARGEVSRIRRYVGVEGGSDRSYLVDVLCVPDDGPEPEPPPDPDPAGTAAAIDFVSALVDRVGDRIDGDPLGQLVDPLDTIMAAPEFDTPMARDLREISQDWLLPGADEVPKDTLGALSTNPEFLESYMTGLSYEMARELAYRGFPTDLRGTYFKRFWDKRAMVPKPDDETLLEDIIPIHEWDDKGPNRRKPSPLGSNVSTGSSTASGESPQESTKVVLIVRGELLRRYPGTNIYAAKAEAKEAADSDPNDPSYKRVPKWAPADSTVTRNGGNQKYPIFRGTLDPDVTYLGFELGVSEAHGDWRRGDDPSASDLGWFFVLEEPPAETRFGLDVGSADDRTRPYGVTYTANGSREQDTVPQSELDEDPEVGWAGLSWRQLPTSGSSGGGTMAGEYIDVRTHRPGAAAEDWTVTAGTPWGPKDDEDDDEWPEEYLFDPEEAADWGYNAAHQAFITWQPPVRIAVHADDLLPQTGGNP